MIFLPSVSALCFCPPLFLPLSSLSLYFNISLIDPPLCIPLHSLPLSSLLPPLSPLLFLTFLSPSFLPFFLCSSLPSSLISSSQVIIFPLSILHFPSPFTHSLTHHSSPLQVSRQRYSRPSLQGASRRHRHRQRMSQYTGTTERLPQASVHVHAR